jgi:tetratricopeptide (TPR) repeat protein
VTRHTLSSFRRGGAAIAFVALVLVAAGKLPFSAPGKRPLLDGLSEHHKAITTSSPLTQKYFDQGLRLVYAFNHDEAIRAFEQALVTDSDCAMCWWGIALSLGPNINLPMDPALNPRAVEAVGKAVAREAKASPAERAYIDALAKRYSADPGAERAALDQTYADAMREVAKNAPDDLDAATLFAESLMDLSPWDYWTKEGQPKQHTEEIVSQLERVLKANPDHPGANHYYIHAVEASRDPGRALPSAKRLETLAPTAGHLVHMSAHTYMRVGRYHDASTANARGAKADELYTAWCKNGGFYPLAYYTHNLHFLWASQTMEGRSKDALASAKKLGASITPEIARSVPPAHELFAVQYVAPVRFGKWDAVLAMKAPPDDLRYALGMYHHARGMAFVAKGKLDEARAEHEKLSAIADEDAMRKLEFLEGPASQVLGVASHVLAAEISAAAGSAEGALAELDGAQQLEYGLRYTEPPPWYLPVHQLQGAQLLKLGRAVEAEAAFRADLVEYPENGWSLFGLAESLKAQQKDDSDARKRFTAAWTHADVKLTRPRF